MEYKLYVGNLPYDVSETDLQELFTQSGVVKLVTLIKDKYSGQSKGFAFVEMENQAGMDNAIATLNNKEFKDRNLSVSVARPREDRRDFGGGNRGGGNYSGNHKHKVRGNRRQY